MMVILMEKEPLARYLKPLHSFSQVSLFRKFRSEFRPPPLLLCAPYLSYKLECSEVLYCSIVL